MDPITILAALGPLAVDLGKSLIGRFISPDGFKPTNIADYTAMKNVDLEMFKALNTAGGNNPSYPWVEAITRLMRPFVATIVLAVWAYAEVTGTPSDSLTNLTASVFFYLFGDRSLTYARKALDKP